LSFLDRGLKAAAPDSSLVSDRWWSSSSGPAYRSHSGITVTPDLAMQVSCIVRGGRIYSETLSTLPLHLYKEDGAGKRKAKDHYLWPTLRKRPNPWQTAQQWRALTILYSIYWGIGLSEIRVSGGELMLLPIHPNWIAKTEQVDGSLKLRYTIEEPGKPKRILMQDEVFRLEGFGVHSFIPSVLLSLARETVGSWIAKGRFGALYFARGANPSVWLQFPKKLGPEQYAWLKEQAEARLSGFANHHKPLLIDDGATVKEVSHNAKDAQLNEALDCDVHDFARWFGLPVHHFYPVNQTTNYASAETFNQNTIDYSFRPVAVSFEQSCARDLFPDEDDLYVEHNFDGLMRGNTVERAQAQRTWVEAGIVTRNEARAKENLPPLPGLDEPLTPLNMERTTGAPSPAPAPKPPQPPPKKKKAMTAAPRRLFLIARGAAERVVRKEISAVSDKAGKLASNPTAWSGWLYEFYDAHAELIMETLQLEPAVAREYAESHRIELLAHGVGAAETWSTSAVQELVRLAELSEESTDV
jgi:HK97 family phage portal protein